MEMKFGFTPTCKYFPQWAVVGKRRVASFNVDTPPLLGWLGALCLPSSEGGGSLRLRALVQVEVDGVSSGFSIICSKSSSLMSSSSKVSP